MIRALVLLVAMTAASIAEACTCEPPPDSSEALLASADVIFEGTAGASNDARAPRNANAFTPPGYTETRFTVTRVWKGAETKTLTVGSSSVCGRSFPMGEKWLVFAWKNEDGSLSTGRCTSSRKLEFAHHELDLLAKSRK